MGEARPFRGGHGQALADLLRQATQMYLGWVPVLLPTFVVTFVLLRELLLIVLAAENLSPVALLLVATGIQALIPAFLGSLLMAAAVLVL
ncbi:MAG: hypothetical protein M3357_13365, partial [Actinomycetota bacterium]|nr:hypothetical protein [Actinomycetota bacterium]